MRVEEVATPQAVDVYLADRGAAGVKVGGCFRDTQDPHVFGKLRVQATPQSFEWY